MQKIGVKPIGSRVDDVERPMQSYNIVYLASRADIIFVSQLQP